MEKSERLLPLCLQRGAQLSRGRRRRRTTGGGSRGPFPFKPAKKPEWKFPSAPCDEELLRERRISAPSIAVGGGGGSPLSYSCLATHEVGSPLLQYPPKTFKDFQERCNS